MQLLISRGTRALEAAHAWFSGAAWRHVSWALQYLCTLQNKACRLKWGNQRTDTEWPFPELMTEDFVKVVLCFISMSGPSHWPTLSGLCLGPESIPVPTLIYYVFWCFLPKHSFWWLEPTTEGSYTIQHECKDWIGKQEGTRREDDLRKES